MDEPPPLERFNPKPVEGTITASSRPVHVSGLKRGFLDTKPKGLPPGATPIHNPRSSLVLPEVQRAMGQDWMTPSLLELLAADPVLSQALGSDEFQDLIRLIRTDPSKAQSMLSSNAELENVFKSWTKLMGNHFDALAAKETRALDEPSKDAAKLLQDPDVQNIIKLIRRGHRLDPRHLETLNPILASKVKALMNSGYLALTH